MADEANSELDKSEREHLLRALALVEAWNKPAPVVVESIRFDLRCAVDKDAWRPICPLGLFDRHSAIYGPELIFPWTPPWQRELMAKVIDPIDVQAGSTILVAFVSTNVLKFPSAAFAGPERSEGKQAKLFVLRPDGQSTVVQRPMILLTRLATEAFIEIGDYSSAKASMVAALERELGIGDLEELNGVPMEEWPNIRAEATLPHRRALIAYLEAEESYEPDQYVVFGYLMAKAEAESELLNFALRGRQAERSQVTASEARRLQSRQATEKLRILARQLIEADREISLSRCARKVADTVSSDPTWEFKSDPTWISKHIKELFERRGGRLEYRPKRDLLPLTTDDHQETFGDH